MPRAPSTPRRAEPLRIRPRAGVPGLVVLRGKTNNPRRESRQGIKNEKSACFVVVWQRGRYSRRENLKRLSATDISALASMKNVAKCDTWCELQNPVNHRVFERKLRPKPLGRGHVCLGVTHRRPRQTPSPRAGIDARAEIGLPCAHRSRLV